MPSSHVEVTKLLHDWASGDSRAYNRLITAVYHNVRRQARRQLGKERSDHTLQPTALVHEAYLRLVDQPGVGWQSRRQFYAAAAEAMRRILIEHARRKKGPQRNAGVRVAVDNLDEFPADGDVDIYALGLALERLAEVSPRQARIVGLRFLVGLTIEETAEVIGISRITVTREWRMARAWLLSQLSCTAET